jgi:hypothetical protein
MDFNVTDFVLGVASGAIVVLSIAYPRVGRIVARTLSVALIAGGVGLLTWAIDSLVRGDALRAMVWGCFSLSEPSEAIGAGTGLLIGGGLALLLSFSRGRGLEEGLSSRSSRVHG